MKNYILLALGFFSLSGCAVTKQAAPIEYHHANSNLSSARTVNENTIEVISNEGEVVSSNLNSEKIEVLQPKRDNEDDDYVVPAAKTSEDKPIHEIEDADDEQVIKPAPQKVTTKIEAESKKQVAPVKQAYLNPVEGAVVTKFGAKTEHGTSKGINISAPEGTKVVASANGKVIYADYDATFGNLVIIKLDNKNIVLSYAHLEDLTVTKGTTLKQGEIVGYVGTTGKVKGPQLHFAMREGKNAIDPLKFLHY
jgi:murein DD-endopeptidase MepM/ murein hydrolase activator NlpD